jgi:hypothetical protein
VSPPVADQLRGRSLMSLRKYPNEFHRLGEDLAAAVQDGPQSGRLFELPAGEPPRPTIVSVFDTSS